MNCVKADKKISLLEDTVLILQEVHVIWGVSLSLTGHNDKYSWSKNYWWKGSLIYM